MNEKPNVPEELLKLIKNEMNRWNQSENIRTFEGKDKGKIIAEIVKEYFEIDKENKTDLNPILKKLSINIIKTDLNDFNNGHPDNYKTVWGAWKGGNIYISDHLKTSRAERFTIAHELGHIFIDYNKKIDVFYRIRTSIGNTEIIINDFAANLLVPNVNEDFYNNFRNESSYNIAKNYDVPIDTISILAERYYYEIKKKEL